MAFAARAALSDGQGYHFYVEYLDNINSELQLRRGNRSRSYLDK